MSRHFFFFILFKRSFSKSSQKLSLAFAYTRCVAEGILRRFYRPFFYCTESYSGLSSACSSSMAKFSTSVSACNGVYQHDGSSIFTRPHFASVTIKSFTILKPSLTSLCHAYLIMLIQFLCVRHFETRTHTVPPIRPIHHCTNLKYTSILIAAN